MITDLTKEHPDKLLWRFWLPLMISVIFQQFYNIADSMIAGKFAGESALGAVGASYPITIIYMAFAVGMNLGASVVISRLFGAGDKAGLRRAVSTAFISVLVLSVLLSVFGYFCSGAMMRWIHTPEDIMADGVLYLKIYVYGLSFLLFYNVCTGIFTALGDSKTPLYFLIGSSLGNSGLSVCGTVSVGRSRCGMGHFPGAGRIGCAGIFDAVAQACSIYQGTGETTAV